MKWNGDFILNIEIDAENKEELIDKLNKLNINELNIKSKSYHYFSPIDENGNKMQVGSDGQYYSPMCPYGYQDCIYDVNYIKHNHPKWYKELGEPTECNCDNGMDYDDEDK